jgi:hypothetical protein
MAKELPRETHELFESEDITVSITKDEQIDLRGFIILF